MSRTRLIDHRGLCLEIVLALLAILIVTACSHVPALNNYAVVFQAQMQTSPRELWVYRDPFNHTIWFISYAIIKNNLVTYAISSDITILRMSDGGILSHIKTDYMPTFALPIPHIHDGTAYLTTDLVVSAGRTLLRVSLIDESTVWKINLTSQITSGTLLEDVDGDKIWDLLVGDSTGNVYLVSSRNGTIIWLRNTNTMPVIGIADFYVYSGSKQTNWTVSKYNLDGTLLWARNLTMGVENPWEYRTYIDLIADTNGDGYKEVAVATDTSVVLLDGFNGSILWSKPFTIKPHMVLRANGDYDGDGVHDILVGTDNGVYMLSSISGKLLWSNPVGYVFSIDNYYYGDLNSDGYREIVISTDKGVYMLNGKNGEILWFYKPDRSVTSTAWRWVWTSDEDIDGDGYPDPLIGTGNGYIIALSTASIEITPTPSTSTEISNLPLMSQTTPAMTPTQSTTTSPIIPPIELGALILLLVIVVLVVIVKTLLGP